MKINNSYIHCNEFRRKNMAATIMSDERKIFEIAIELRKIHI